MDTESKNGIGKPPRPEPIAITHQKVQTVLLEGAGAEWVRLLMDHGSPTLIIEMLGGDEERARGLIVGTLPVEIPYELRTPATRTACMVRAVRAAAKVNRAAQRSYNKVMLRAIRAIGGSFNPRA